MKKVMSGREFIKMIRPLLGIEQTKIRSISIKASINDVVSVELECIGKQGSAMNVAEELSPNKFIRRFVVDVTEVLPVIDTTISLD
jgi:hypothetical protein